MSKKIADMQITPAQMVKLPKLEIRPWMEIIGEYIGDVKKGSTFHLAIGVEGKPYRLTVSTNSNEYRIITKVLKSMIRSRNICILVTDDPDEPLRINLITVK